MSVELQSFYFEDLTLGQRERLSKTVTEADVLAFAEVSGDFNPIHVDKEFAAKTQFGERIAHGMLSAGLISAVLGTRLPGPGAVYISQVLNFRGPVRINDTVDVEVTVAELIPERCRVRLNCLCSVKGEPVVEGEAWLKVPSKLPKPPKA